MPKDRKKEKPRKNSAKRYRNVVFTLNNYSAQEEEELTQWLQANCNYYVYGREIGEEKKTPHLQGYCEFKSKQSHGQLCKVIRGYVAPRKGTALQNQLYCKKSGDYVEWGTPKTPGHFLKYVLDDNALPYFPPSFLACNCPYCMLYREA